MKIVRQNIDKDKLYFHKSNVQKMKASIEKELVSGFKAMPDYRTCKDCPLFATCTSRAEYPLITEVYY
jgi:hypothetical protein